MLICNNRMVFKLLDCSSLSSYLDRSKWISDSDITLNFYDSHCEIEGACNRVKLILLLRSYLHNVQGWSVFKSNSYEFRGL